MRACPTAAARPAFSGVTWLPPRPLPRPAQCGLRTRHLHKHLGLVAKSTAKTHRPTCTQCWWLVSRPGLSLYRCASAPIKVCHVRAVERFKDNTARWLQGGVTSPAAQPLVGQALRSFCLPGSPVTAPNVQRWLVASPRSQAKERESRGSGCCLGGLAAAPADATLGAHRGGRRWGSCMETGALGLTHHHLLLSSEMAQKVQPGGVWLNL